MTSTTQIKRSYQQLRCLYVGTEVLGQGLVQQGRVTVLLEKEPDFVLDGKLNSHGLLSGMAKLYRHLNLQIGDTVEYSVEKENVLTIHNRAAALREVTSPVVASHGTVFERKSLKYIHIELFRAENLNHWEPETETDLYLAFGVLQDFTDFQYCCGASTALLDRLGYKADTKPDAIVIDRTTERT